MHPRGRPSPEDVVDPDELIDQLVDGGLRAVFQPIVRAVDREVVGYEALCRSVEPVAVPVSDWFTLASRVGRRVELERACLLAIAEAGAPPGDSLLFVNVSPALLAEPGAFELRALLPARLVLELTEREQVEDVAQLQADLEPWLQSGARLGIDDAGAGYSSLKQIVELLPEFLKLDRSLIIDIHQDRHRQALVAALAGFAAEIGANLIAEGVESPAELAWLQDADVGLVQGFLLSRPGKPWPEVVRLDTSGTAASPRLDRLARRLEAARTQREACEAVAAHLYRRDGLLPSVYLEMGGRLRCQAQRGLWQVLDGMAPTAGITGRTFRTGEAQRVSDIGDADDYLEAIPGVVAELCVPLSSDGVVIGALNVESLVPIGPASEAEVEACADLLGQRLADLQPEQSRVPMRRLANTAASLVAVEEPRQTVEAVLAAARDLSGMDSALVALRGPGGELSIQGTAGPLAAGLDAMSSGELRQLFAVLEPLTSCYTAGDATGRTVTASTGLREAGARALVALPLIARGRRIGLLVVAHRRPLALGSEQVEPLELLAVLAGSCVEMASTVQELRLRASRDPLTGLGNHSSFHETLAELGSRPAALVMFDIDGFKKVNDESGHLVGDEALRVLAAALRESVPEPGAVFRIGGDELAVVLTGRHEADAEEATKRVVAAGRAALAEFGAGLSAGLAHRRPAEPLLETLARADARLYRSKRSRRSRNAQAFLMTTPPGA